MQLVNGITHSKRLLHPNLLDMCPDVYHCINITCRVSNPSYAHSHIFSEIHSAELLPLTNQSDLDYLPHTKIRKRVFLPFLTK